MSITAGRLHIYSKPPFEVVVFDFSQAVWLNDHAVVVVYSGTNFGGDAVRWQHCGFGTIVAAEAKSEFSQHEEKDPVQWYRSGRLQARVRQQEKRSGTNSRNNGRDKIRDRVGIQGLTQQRKHRDGMGHRRSRGKVEKITYYKA